MARAREERGKSMAKKTLTQRQMMVFTTGDSLYFIPTISLLNVLKGGSRMRNTGLQVLGLIVVIKFSREFGRYLLY